MIFSGEKSYHTEKHQKRKISNMFVLFPSFKCKRLGPVQVRRSKYSLLLLLLTQEMADKRFVTRALGKARTAMGVTNRPKRFERVPFSSRTHCCRSP